MITYWTLLLLIIVLFLSLGLSRYVKARSSIIRSRSAVLTLFAHGMGGSAAAVITVSAVHPHSIGLFGTTFHVHDIQPLLLRDVALCVPGCALINTILLTLGVCTLSFVLNQTTAHKMIRDLEKRMDHHLSRDISRRYLNGSESLYVIRDGRFDIFSVAVLKFSRSSIPKMRDMIVLTTAALKILEPDELETVIAHERFHVRDRDTHYLPFFHTLSTLVFFDPIVKHLRERLFRHAELTADMDAAMATKKPLALARSLVKAYLYSNGAPVIGILGGGRRSFLIERINRLITLEAVLIQRP